MAIDKQAILESAQLHTSKGQYDKAIAEWKKLTTGAPADATIYNTIGDLHLKRAASNDAIDAFFQAAAAFRAGDAALKAIALYKKF
ncbi:MAG: tetratricopeptide repeat protein [Nitrospiraceae bacterium]